MWVRFLVSGLLLLLLLVVAPSLWSPPPPPLEPLPPPRLLLEDRSFAWQLYAGLLSVHWPPPGSVAILHSSLALRPPEPLNRAQVSEDRAVHGQSARYGLSFSVNVSQCQCPVTDGIPRSQTICDAPLQIFASGRPHVDTTDPNVN